MSVLRPNSQIALILLAFAATTQTPAVASADAPNPLIAGVGIDMTAAQVRHRLGSPLRQGHSGHAIKWYYQDKLSVYFSYSTRSHRHLVSGVRTRSPRDVVKDLHNAHVGSSERLLTRDGRLGAQCFEASVPDPGGTLRRGRYCQFPIYYSDDSLRTLYLGPAVAILFRIKRGRVVQLTVQFQPRHR